MYLCRRECARHLQPDHSAPPHSLQLGLWVHPAALWARRQEGPQLPRVHPVPAGTLAIYRHPLISVKFFTSPLRRLYLHSAFWCQVFFFSFFFRSCSWSMHARHSPKRTKARMASSPPWTSVTLWPPSDTTCSHRLWRRTLSQWVCLCVRGANWQNNLSPQRIFRWWSKNNFHSWKLSRFSSYSAVTSPTFWSSKLLIVHVKLGQKVFHVPQKIINNTYILITCKWRYNSLTGYENIHTQQRQILSRFQSGVISLTRQYWPLSPWAFLIWIIF